MSANNYYSTRDKNTSYYIDSLPNISNRKFSYRTVQDVHAYPSHNGSINRNINYSFEMQPYYLDDNVERSGTPFSDFFSESETGTPDFQSEESDSSAGSVLQRSTAEATKTLSDEWERIERTIYDEEGEKVTRPQMLEECKQWKQLHPHLRVVGKAIPLPERRPSYRQIEHDEVIAVHYSDYEDFSESAERLSQSSTDVTPQNSPRVSTDDFEPRIYREKVTFHQPFEELSSDFCSILQITPIQIRSPRKRQNSSILKSEIASSKWMRNRPDSSVNCDRNSAKSFMSLDTRNFENALSASDRNKVLNRVTTARQRDLNKLKPLYSPDTHTDMRISKSHINRKVSLPPLLLEEEKRKINTSSGKKVKLATPKSRKNQKSVHMLDRVKR